MQEILLTSVALSKKLVLDNIASYFHIDKPSKWKDYILIEGTQLEQITKYEFPNGKVYIYDFGALTFVNFSIQEIKRIMDYLETLIGAIDYNLFMDSLESHTICIDDDNQCFLWAKSDSPVPYAPYILPIASEILAQSVAMEKIEIVLSDLLDQTDDILEKLKYRKLRARSKKICRFLGKIIKYQHTMINSIHIFDRPKFKENLGPKEVHEQLASYYELYDRFNIIKTKSDDLLKLYDTYMELTHHKLEYRLYIFETFLLALFPIYDIFSERTNRYIYKFVEYLRSLF